MTIYDVFFFAFSIIYLPYLVIKGKAHRDFAERFGKLPPELAKIGKLRPVWIHAVSVGEVAAAKNFIEGISGKFPGKKIVLSTTTRTGNEIARKILAEDVFKFYFPLDFSFTVKRALDVINPSLVVIMETELWPNLILELSKRGVPVALINGRLSDRSFRGYKRIRFLFENILKKIDLFCMQTKADADRIKALGAPRDKVMITGNMKFDIENSDKLLNRPTRSTYEVDTEKIVGDGRLVIAGSTHGGEEEILLEVYNELVSKFADLRLLIAPRHIDRTDTIKLLVEQNGFEALLLSRVRKEPKRNISGKEILILDTLGELKNLYGLATVVFMGGSLVKRGGHNMVEPAVFGKPIIVGPYTFNFRDMTKYFLGNNGAIGVRDKDSLLRAFVGLLSDKDKRETMGRNARGLIDSARGATLRNIEETEKLLQK